MLARRSFPWIVLLVSAGSAYACGSGGSSDTPDDGAHVVSGGAGKGGVSAAGGAAAHLHGGAAGSGGAAGAGGHGAGGGLGIGAGGGTAAGLVATCTPAVLAVGPGAPTSTCKATLDGAVVTPVWSVDRGEIGAVDKVSGVFTPSGNVGGVATMTAGYGMKSATATVTVSVHINQTGAGPHDNVGMMTAGGVGGVGGEGVGPAPGPAVKGALGMPPLSAGAPTFLYPYDQTVWPRGLLPPLLQWQPAAGGPQTFDGVSIHLETKSKSFVYDGSFGIPAGATNLLHHPIPIDAWHAATESAGSGDTLTITMVLSSGGKAYGPLTETWAVAPGRLGGAVYYNAYNTGLAKNYPGGMNETAFGAAVLSIAVGDMATGPTLVAGSTNPADPTDTTKCRTCHSVAAGGTRLVVQHGDNYAATSAYELGSGNTETPITAPSVFGWSALYPDGSFALTNQAPLSAAVAAGAGLYSLPDGAPIAAPGLSAIAANVGTPSFSVDGKHAAFNVIAATDPDNNKNVMGPTLVATSFDLATKTFAGPKVVADTTGDASGSVPSWPAFLPTNDALVFQRSPGVGTGSLSQVWWTDLATGNASLLNHLNGLGDDGKPTIPSTPDHTDDTQRNYEPTVGPLATGGYAWVIFTSRRLYGNIATLPPGASDPRNVDLVTGVSPKKLWVAAVDLNAPPGTDPSHPAFYLPAQELHGSNSRGFWVFGPCKQDGGSCETGDQCCAGYCRPGEGSGLQCSTMKPSCAAEQEMCKVAADCCNPKDMCLNGFCAANAGDPH